MVMVCLIATAVRAQDRGDAFLEQERVAFEHFERADWSAAIAAFERQIAIFEDNPRPYYNIACAHARQGNAERAATWLQLSIRHGWRNVKHLDGDSDLDGVRSSAEFKRVRAQLDDLSPIRPHRLPISSAPSASSVARILADGILERVRLDVDPRLWEPDQIRARMFAHFDRQMARLARYIGENGDARDAHVAGRERVRLASLYRLGAEEIGTTYVRLTVEEFIERWPNSPYLFEVRLWGAVVEPGFAALRQLVADAPRGDAGARALAELCLRDRAARAPLYHQFVERYGDTVVGQELVRRTLWRVRLEVDGLPDGLQFEPGIEHPREGRLVLGIVRAGDEKSLAAAKKHAGDGRLALVVLGGAWTGTKAHLARDPLEAVRLLGVPEAPLFLVFENGRLSRD